MAGIVVTLSREVAACSHHKGKRHVTCMLQAINLMEKNVSMLFQYGYDDVQSSL